MSPDTSHADILILGFSASRAGRNKILLFIDYPVCGILLEWHRWTKIPGTLLEIPVIGLTQNCWSGTSELCEQALGVILMLAEG